LGVNASGPRPSGNGHGCQPAAFIDTTAHPGPDEQAWQQIGGSGDEYLSDPADHAQRQVMQLLGGMQGVRQPEPDDGSAALLPADEVAHLSRLAPVASRVTGWFPHPELRIDGQITKQTMLGIEITHANCAATTFLAWSTVRRVLERTVEARQAHEGGSRPEVCEGCAALRDTAAAPHSNAG